MTTALLLALVACGQDAIPTSPSGPEQNALVSVVRVQPSDAVVAPDEAVRLSAIVKSARGQTVNGRPVTWSSSDESVAYVDQNGQVVAGREGTATITANVLGVRGTATVDVRGTVVDIEILEPADAIQEGDVESLTATYVYSNGARRTASYVRWQSRNPKILWVDGQGDATGRSAGEAEVVVEGRGRRSEKKLDVGAGNIVSVTVHATATTLEVGEHAEAWADILNHKNRRVTKPVSWSSSHPSVATISSSGRVSAKSVGQTTLTGTVSGVSGSLDIAVVSASSSSGSGGSNGGSGGSGGSSGGSGGPANPGTVTDLAAQGTGETTIQLRFTEVDDGTGSPASYVIRYLPASEAFDWNTALDVSKGTCASPVAGSSTGNVRTCTVDGLVASTEYIFQLVAFRVSSGEKVFGALSNQDWDRTTDPSIVVDVVPSAFSLDIGQQKQLTATVMDSYGNEMQQSVAWTSTSSGVASVNSGGTVSGVSAGSATIRATATGSSGSSSATIIQPAQSGGSSGSGSSGSGSSGSGGPPPNASVSPGPNLPGHLSFLAEGPYDDLQAMTSQGWAVGLGKTGTLQDGSTYTNPEVVPSPDGAFPSTHVARHTWPQGLGDAFGRGTSGGTRGGWEHTQSTELYLSWWVRYDPRYRNSSGNHKMIGIGAEDGKQYAWIRASGDAPTLRLDVNQKEMYATVPQTKSNILRANVGDGSIALGRVYQIELYVRMDSSPGAGDGVLKMWKDGRLTHDYRNVYWRDPTSGRPGHFAGFVWDPIVGARSPAPEAHMWLDDVYIAGN